MSQRRRCTECRKWFVPKPTAVGHQRVCGPQCRSLRRRKLARGRRREDLDEQRTDERLRQRKHRDASKCAGRHAPASDGKYAELLAQLRQIVDDAARLSRAAFERDARRILRRSALFSDADVDGAGPRHAPASAPEGRQNSSRSAADVDGVTDWDGS